MTKGVRTFAIVLSVPVLFACSPKQPPQPDPLKQEITILQQQLLELQKQQNATAAAVDSLSTRVQTIEEKRATRAEAAPQGGQKSPAVQAGQEKQPAAAKKKPVKQPAKKKKKARR